MKASMQDHAAQDEAVLDQERGKIVDLGRLSPGLEDQEDEQEAEAEAEEEEQALRAEHAQGLRALFGKHARQALAAIKFTNAIGGIGHHDEAAGDNHEAATDGHSIKTAAAEPYVPLINGEAARIFRPEVHAPLKLVFGVRTHTHTHTHTSKPFSCEAYQSYNTGKATHRASLLLSYASTGQEIRAETMDTRSPDCRIQG